MVSELLYSGTRAVIEGGANAPTQQAAQALQ